MKIGRIRTPENLDTPQNALYEFQNWYLISLLHIWNIPKGHHQDADFE